MYTILNDVTCPPAGTHAISSVKFCKDLQSCTVAKWFDKKNIKKHVWMWITSQAQESSGIKALDLWYRTNVCQTLPCQRVRPRENDMFIHTSHHVPGQAEKQTNNASGVVMISQPCSWRLWIFYLQLEWWKIFFGCDGDTRDDGHSWALMDMNSKNSNPSIDVCIACTIRWIHQKWVEQISKIWWFLFSLRISLHRESHKNPTTRLRLCSAEEAIAVPVAAGEGGCGILALQVEVAPIGFVHVQKLITQWFFFKDW